MQFHSPHEIGPTLVIALALAVGMLAQSLARHLKIPGIVVLLAAGVLLGPDVLDIIRPESLGTTLQAIVGFAVAVILFEGGMNLNWSRLRRQGRAIRQLVTIGGLVTAAGASFVAHWILEWSWTLSILFGTLVIVTGPTVINPLLRRIRVKPKIATVLEAEGILVDAVGAIVAVVALEVVLSPASDSLAQGALDLASRLGFGVLAGLIGGLTIAGLLRLKHGVPEGLENVFTLSLALLLFQASNAFLPESGIMTVTMAGLVVGNVRTRALQELREFKEQLTVLLIGMLFVLLAADVRVEEVLALGYPGLSALLALMLLVRPVNIVLGTWGSNLDWKEKTFLSWLAPRGIVAAAVSSLFAQSLDAAGIPGGSELRAMVFLVIAGTVLVQGLTGGFVAGLLGLRMPRDNGYVLVGAGDLGRALARVLRDGGEDVVLIDSSHDNCRAAEDEGFRVLHGSALEEGVLLRAGLDGRTGALAVTPNDEINLLFAKKSREDFRVPRLWIALRRGHRSVTPEMVKQASARLLFAAPRTLDLWSLRLERGLARQRVWIRESKQEPDEAESSELWSGLHDGLLAVAVRNGKKVVPVDETVRIRRGSTLVSWVVEDHSDDVNAWMEAHGWAEARDEDGGQDA